MAGQAKVDPQIILREIASTAANLVQLDQIAGRGTEARVEGKQIAFGSLKLEADPMIDGAALGAQDHRFSLQIFDHNFQVAVVEQVANRKPAAHLRDLYRGSGEFTGVAEGPVVLIKIKQLRLSKSGTDIFDIHLRVNMAIDEDQVRPPIVVYIEEGVSPAHVGCGSAGYPRRAGNVGKVKATVVTV